MMGGANFRRIGGVFVFWAIVNGVLLCTVQQAVSAAKLDDRLVSALRHADAAACERLIAQMPDQLDAQDDRGWTPLMYAAFYSDADFVRVFLERGADVGATNHAGATALHYAATSSEKVRHLLEAGAEVNVATKLGNTPLMLACRTSASWPVVDQLLAAGAEVNARNHYGVTALMIAASTDDARTVKGLLDRGADPSLVPHPNPTDADGRSLDSVFGGFQSALAWAARTGHLEIVQLLLDAGADVNGASLLGPPLISAAQANRTEIARLLLDRGANVEGMPAIGGWTPLMWAAANEYGDANLVKLLLERTANVHAEGGAEWGPFMEVPQSPLMIAMRRGNTEVVDALRSAGARPTEDPWAAKVRTPPVRDVTAESADARQLASAVAAALPLLERAAIESIDEFAWHGQSCISCHNQLLPLLAVSFAGKGGVAHDEQAAVAMERILEGALQAFGAYNAESTMDPAPSSFNGYLLWGLASESVEQDVHIDAAVHAVAVHQAADGRWRQFVPRPPITDSEISSTALGIRALTLYTLPGQKAELDARVALARQWLSSATPRSTEDHVYKLLGLYWAGESSERLTGLAEALAALQRADGGWGQLPGLESDAYATGQALYALAATREAEITGDTMRKGLEYLVRSQLHDGSWFVRRRAYPFQPTMDAKFPHGRDAWISAAATSWAVMALSVSLEKQHAVANTIPAADPVASQAADVLAARLPRPAGRPVDYAHDILPILETSCLDCHSSSDPAGQYSLETRASLIRGGMGGPPVVVPGDSARSRLVHHVAGLVEDVEMPPPTRRDEYDPLSDEQIALLRAWIDQGLPGIPE